MKQTNFKISSLAAVVLFAASGVAQAETLSVPATVTVDNTINFTVTGSLDLGTIRAKVENSNIELCVGLVIPANPASAVSSTLPTGSDAAQACDGTTGTNNAEIQAVGGTIARPTFAITGLPAFTKMKLTLPAPVLATPLELKLATPPPNASVFQLYDFTAYQTSGTAGAVTNELNADAAGEIAFTVGATIITDPTNTAITEYENAAYSGSFDVVVTY